jgi:hypothetical protein
MKAFFERVKRWYRWRFQGIVEPPRQYGGQGTTWQQHPKKEEHFKCACGWPGPGIEYKFHQNDYKIVSQDHVEGCEGVIDAQTHKTATDKTRIMDLRPCECPVTEARYVMICPTCRMGHWKQAGARP